MSDVDVTETETDEEAPVSRSEFAKWQEQMQSLTAERDEYAMQNQLLMQNSAQAAPAPQPQAQPAPPPPPDPEEDLAGFLKWHEGRTAAFVRQETQKVRDEVVGQYEHRNQSDRALTHFLESHPEFKGREDLVEMAATRVAQAAIEKNLDVNAYVFGMPDRFNADVKKQIDAWIPGAGETKSDTPDPAHATSLLPDTNAFSPSTPPPGEQKAPNGLDQVNDFISDIRNIQRGKVPDGVVGIM